MRLDDMVRLVDSEDPIKASDEMEQLRQVDKSWMQQESYHCSYDDLTIIEGQNKYTIEHEGVPFECLFIPNKEKKIYVMFSAARAWFRRSYPSFMRWKYQKYFKGNILCVDDPMYHFHPDTYGAAWYYGTKDVSYLELLVDIVKKLCKQLDIEAEQVVFVGSSAGGTSALYCANIFDDSAAIVSNPQFELKDLQPKNTASFLDIGIDLFEKDKLNRNHMMLTNTKSKFVIMMNFKSKEDYEKQYLPFFERQNLTPKYGITQLNNIITWIHGTNYWDPHKLIPGEVEFLLMDFLVNKARQGEDINEINNFSILVNQSFADLWDVKWKNENLIAEKDEIAAERDLLHSFFVKNISEYICDILTRKIPKNMSSGLRKFVEYDYDISHVVRKTGYIDYCIGKQYLYKYNIFHLKGKYYFRLKFLEYANHFSKKDEMDKYLESILGEKIQKFFVDATGALIVAVEINPDEAEKQIADFVDFSLELIGKYL